MVIKQVDLQFTQGTSDKVYMVALHQYGDASYGEKSFRLICHYGRRGSTLKEVDKGTFYDFGAAYSNYCKIIEQKKSKGYWITATFDHDLGTKPVEKPVSIVEKVVSIVEEKTYTSPESWTSTEDERQRAIARLKKACA